MIRRAASPSRRWLTFWLAILLPLWVSAAEQKNDRAMVGRNLVTSQIAAAETTGEHAYYRQALSQAAKLPDVETRFAAILTVLRSQLLHGDAATAWSSYVEAQSALDQLLPGSVHSHAASVLAQGLLSGPNGQPAIDRLGIEKARLLIDQTETAPDRAAAMQAVAAAELAQSGKHADPAGLRASGVIEESLRNALALPLDTPGRAAYLKRLADASIDAHDIPRAIDALGGIPDAAIVDPAALDLTLRLIQAKEFVFAEQAAALIAAPDEALPAVEALAEAYHDLGYTARVAALDERLRQSLARIDREHTPKSTVADAMADAASHLALMGDIAHAEEFYGDAKASSHKDEVAGSLAMAYAETGDTDAARTWYGRIDTPAIRNIAAGKVATALAAHDDRKAARKLLADAALTSDRAEDARLALVEADVAAKAWGDAEEDAKALQAVPRRAGALAFVAAALVKHGGEAEAIDRLFADAAALAASGGEEAKARIAAGLAQAGRIDAAKAMLAPVAAPETRRPAEVALAVALANADHPNEAYDFAHALTPVRNHDEALAALGTTLAERHLIRLATQVVPEITDRPLRVRTFRRIAEWQAADSDVYGILGKGVPTPFPNGLRLPGRLAVATATPDALKAYDDETMEMVKTRTDPVLMRTPLPVPVGGKLPPLYRPEVLKYDAAWVASKIPAPTPFRAERVYYQNSNYNLKFYFASGNQDYMRRQGTLAPDILTLESGVIDISRLADYLAQKGLAHDLEPVASEKGRVYILRRPVVIGPNATLVVSSADVDELRLSGEEGAYLVNGGGKLFIHGVKFTGWSEKGSAPMIVSDEPNTFRPFIASWSRSETNIAGSELTALGYTNSKSYGLSISSGPKAFTKLQARKLTAPSGIIVDNFFRNLLYGFYCYEAADVVLVGNEYRDNYTYAIDPHDRSRHLTIAYNTAYGTHKKHGIIISREVNDSTILGNLTFNNNGSGIMTDRLSSDTLIYANTAFGNNGDGLTVYESGCNIAAANRFFGNNRAGIKIRNAMDVGVFFNELRDNHQSAINGYALDLMHTVGHDTRDIVMDPYTNATSITAIGNLIQNNGIGINGDMLAALTLRGNNFLHQSPRLIRGSWSRFIPQMLSRSDFESEGVFATDRCVQATVGTRSHCRWRDEGYFEGDGQDSLADRLEQNYCKPAAPAEGAVP